MLGRIDRGRVFQTPAPRGGVPLTPPVVATPKPTAPFQTPAPRGGVPLARRRGRPVAARPVSNPCASGRCSSGSHGRRTPDTSVWFQTPAPRGGVPLLDGVYYYHEGVIKFQTPAPRGGVPLLAWPATLISRSKGFKPLRLGAVFLCRGCLRSMQVEVFVSNPCAAGRCSSAPFCQRCQTCDSLFPTPAPRGGVPLMLPSSSTATCS